MQYGTVAHMRALPGKEAEINELLSAEHRRPKGFVAQYVYQSVIEPRDFIMTIVFEDYDSYHDNSHDPEVGANFQKLRALLEDDPKWYDGNIIHSVTV